MNPVLLPWAVELGFITYRSLSGQRFTLQRGNPNTSGPFAMFVNVTNGPKRPPLPSELLATVIAYGTFSVIANSSDQYWRRTGSLLAWGITLATALMIVSNPPKAGSTAPANTNKTSSGNPLPATRISSQ